MSGKNRKMKEIRRRERKARRERSQTMRGFGRGGLPSTLTVVDADGSSQVLQFREYRVTYDALEDNVPDPVTSELDDDARLQLFKDAQFNPAVALPTLRGLIERHPESRTVMNWLCATLSATGQHDEAYTVAEAMYERFPDYLFARCNLVQMKVARGKVAEAEQLLEGLLCVKDLFPHRDTFHITEVATFECAMIDFLCAKGDVEAAARRLDDLGKIFNNDSPIYQQACSQVRKALFKRVTGSELIGNIVSRLTRLGRRRRTPATLLG